MQSSFFSAANRLLLAASFAFLVVEKLKNYHSFFYKIKRGHLCAGSSENYNNMTLRLSCVFLLAFVGKFAFETCSSSTEAIFTMQRVCILLSTNQSSHC